MKTYCTANSHHLFYSQRKNYISCGNLSTSFFLFSFSNWMRYISLCIWCDMRLSSVFICIHGGAEDYVFLLFGGLWVNWNKVREWLRASSIKEEHWKEREGNREREREKKKWDVSRSVQPDRTFHSVEASIHEFYECQKRRLAYFEAQELGNVQARDRRAVEKGRGI